MSSTERLRQATSWRNVLMILAAIWLGLMVYNAFMQLSGLLTIHDYEVNFLANVPYMTLKVWLPWVVASPLIVFFARRLPIRPENWVRTIPLHLLVLLSLSVLTGLALALHYHFREEMSEVMKTYQPWQHTGHYLFGDRLFLYNVIIYTVFIATFNIQNFASMAVQRERDSARLSTQLKEAQIRALKMQINPHFLFNTLNSLSVLVMKGRNESAQEMIRRLGRYFRTSLEESDRQWIPLAQELEATEQYLAIEQIRFSDRLSLEQDHDPSILGVEVPAMILQPLVENAMRHGIAENDGPGRLKLSSRANGSRLKLSVQDNGPGCRFDDPAFVEGVGLRNVRERLGQCYGEDFELILEGRTGAGCTVSMDLPLQPPRAS